MSIRLWDGTGTVLADTSAWMQARRDARARDLLLGAIGRGDVRWCWPVRYELMVDARGANGIAVVEQSLESLHEVPVDRSVQRATLATMRELVAAGSHGAHRFPLTDLAVTAAAQAAGIDVLHFDQHLERLGDHLGVATHWISEPAGRGT
ncbi:MAG TPA: PIN domain-containing protein [Solirubrobacterales bacterium]|nr:PIN domain-containing protein [Solirubrobacterales bacterium]